MYVCICNLSSFMNHDDTLFDCSSYVMGVVCTWPVGDPITINSPSHVWHYFNLFQFCHSPNYYIDIEKLGYIYHFNSCPCMSYKEISMGFQFLYMTSYNVIWNLLHKSLYILAINSFALMGLKHGKWWKIKKHFDRPGYLTDLNKEIVVIFFSD